MVQQDITVQDLKKMIDAKEDFLILDVREPHEYEICNLDGELIPLGELPDRVDELEKSKRIIVHCRSGGRSTQALHFLRSEGFTSVSNLAGGIIAWANEIDPTMNKY